MTYYRFVGIKTAAPGGAGGIGGTPERSSTVLESVGNIMAFPFKDDALDLTGNHVIDTNTPSLITVDPAAAPSNHYTYDGLPMLRSATTTGFAPRIVASTQAHQIPLSEPVTFGFFCYRRNDAATPQFMCSGPGTTSSNYGIQRQASAGWRSLGGGVTTMGDHRNMTPTGKWFHIVLAHSGSRSSSHAGAFYINGQEVWTGDLISSAPAATDDFGFTNQSTSDNSGFNGFMCNCFVTDTLLDAQTIKALSDESFGHASPYAGP